MTLDEVDLYMRSWIEILNNLMARFPSLVDLYMRSWIEISFTSAKSFTFMSTSMWGRELKCWTFVQTGNVLQSTFTWGRRLNDRLSSISNVLSWLNCSIQVNDIVKANKNHRLSLMGLQKQKVKNQYKWKRKNPLCFMKKDMEELKMERKNISYDQKNICFV